MHSFRRLALLLALFLPAMTAALAQSSSSNSNPETPAPAQTQAQQSTAASDAQGQVSVQARIRARRAQRRAAAIKEAYAHLYEVYVGMGYLRFTPGAKLPRVNLYAWDTGFTRYFDQRLGVTLDARGYYGQPFVGLNTSSITMPTISTYAIMGGPTYRFYLQPRYSISGRVMGGWGLGNFSSDTNGFGSTGLGLYPDGSTFALSAGITAEYNVSPNLGLRVTPEYFANGFNSTLQHSLGFTGGIVYRFGKQ